MKIYQRRGGRNGFQKGARNTIQGGTKKTEEEISHGLEKSTEGGGEGELAQSLSMEHLICVCPRPNELPQGSKAAAGG